ncbi:monovalent cation/H+ antiporter complex subunit F [Actinoplanes sp. CA-252034]|uniref:monovalent cation/H+ antiporter complex subunit F n=1 Tax=Actinoplanes sp. CA-252034 TaxID=3239906 RepID=UPI003D995048
MTVVAAVTAVLLAAAAGMALIRIIRGPSTLDRIVGTDVLLAITVCAIATEAAYSRDATGLPILLGLSLLGAAGSVAVARFADPVARPSLAASPPPPAPSNSAGSSVVGDSAEASHEATAAETLPGEAGTRDAPDLPGGRQAPDEAGMPDAPDLPGGRQAPGQAGMPDAPDLPGGRQAPGQAGAPDTPDLPGGRKAPGAARVPVTSPRSEAGE